MNLYSAQAQKFAVCMQSGMFLTGA